MQRALLITAALLVALGSTAEQPELGKLPRDAPEALGFSSARLARLDAALDAYVDEGKLPGYQIAITRHGKVAHARSYGRMDVEAGRALEPDTIFRIYSMSKVVTGIATLIAYERGHFLLTDPVALYLPALGDMKVRHHDEATGKTTLIEAKNPITVLDLLRHTAGISYSFNAPPPLGARYVELSLTPGLRGLPDDAGLGPTGKDEKADLGDMVERLGTLPLLFEPGTAWHYGINQDVLGALIEVTSGQSFPDFLKTHLFEPLRMRDTAFHVPDNKVSRFSNCYGPTEEGGMRLLDTATTSEYRTPPAMPGGGGGMVSTTRDYLRFSMMLANRGSLQGRRVLGRKTVDLAMSDQLPLSVFGPRPLGPAGARTYGNGGIGVRFGLTGSVVTEPAFTALPMSKGTFGWGGAASTFFWVDPEEDLTVVFMTQLVLSGSYPLRAQLFTHVNAALTD
jgi:CubicO group peptidase (beta-lactamase class C family)